MTHGPTYPYGKKTPPKKKNNCTSHNYIIWQCKKLNRFTKSTESVTIMSDLKPFQCLFGKMFSIWWIQTKRHSPVLSGPNLPLLSPASKETEEDLPSQSLELQRASGCKVNQAGSVGSDRLDSDWKSWRVRCFLLPKTDKLQIFLHSGTLNSWPFVVLSLCHAGDFFSISWGLHSSWKGAATWPKQLETLENPQRPLGWSCLTCLTSYMELTVVKSI